MHYPTLSKGNKKKITLDSFNTFPKKSTDYEIISAINTEFLGSIKSRKGVKERGVNLISSATDYDGGIIFSDAIYFKDGEYNKLCIHLTSVDNEEYTIRSLLLSSVGNVTRLADIVYLPDDTGVLLEIISIKAFSATAANGAGVYIFVNTLKKGSFGTDIYELSADLSEWIKIEQQDLYIPTCLINGRGDGFEESGLVLAEPETPEKVNLLNGLGNLFFTTDGYSKNFYMPILSDMTNDDHIKVELQVEMVKKLKFTFPKNNYVSNLVEYKGYTIAAAIEGEFLKIQSSPEGFVPPKIYGKENNLKVTINKSGATLSKQKALMEHIGWYPLTNKGNRLLMCGNSAYPDLCMMSEANNPLYIPMDNLFYLGTDNQKITTVAPVSDAVLIFKESSIYKFQVMGNTRKITRISDIIGTLYKETVRATGKNALFLGNDNRIYAVLSSGEITDISKNINGIPTAKDIAFPFGMISQNYYTLFLGNKAYRVSLVDKNFNQPNFSIYEFNPECTYFSGMEYAGDIVLISFSLVMGMNTYNVVKFEDESRDSYYIKNSGNNLIFQSFIESAVKFKLFISSLIKNKVITRIVLRGKSENPVNVNLIGENGDILNNFIIDMICGENSSKTAYLYPNLNSKECILEVSSLGLTEIKAVEIEYYEL